MTNIVLPPPSAEGGGTIFGYFVLKGGGGTFFRKQGGERFRRGKEKFTQSRRGKSLLVVHLYLYLY